MQYLTKIALLGMLPVLGTALLPFSPTGESSGKPSENSPFLSTQSQMPEANPVPISEFPFLPAPHAFHISKCLLEYNEGEQSVQISLHLFLDDLEEALRRQGADKLFLCTEKEVTDAETYVQRYLNQRLIVRVNGKTSPYTFLGKEISEDLVAVWCYLEITGVPQFKQLSVTNTLLMDLYDDQKNIVSVFGPGKKQGLLLFQKGKDTESVSF